MESSRSERSRHRRPVWLVVAALSLAGTAPAAASIDDISGACRATPGGPILLSAGSTIELTVKGKGVDLVRRVEDVGLGGVTVRIGERRGGSGSSVTLRVTVDTSVRHGDEGRIRLEYPTGEDSFPVKLVGEVTIRSLAVEGVQPNDGRHILDLDRDYTLAVRGTNLAILEAPRLMGDGNQISVAVLSRANDEARLRIRSSTKRGHTIDGSDLQGDGCGKGNLVGSASIKLLFGPDPSDRPAPTRRPAARPTATAVVRPTAPRTPTATRIPQASLPDLVPILEGAPFRHLGTEVRREVNGQIFCSAIVPQAVENTLADLTPGDVRWGVRNAGRSDIAGKFRIRLTTGAHVEDRTIVGLRAGETKLFDVRRPASRTNVTRIGLEPDAATRQRYGALSGGRCVQSDPQQNPSLEWQDPSFEVEVDTSRAVNEGPTGGETNNTSTF